MLCLFFCDYRVSALRRPTKQDSPLLRKPCASKIILLTQVCGVSCVVCMWTVCGVYVSLCGVYMVCVWSARHYVQLGGSRNFGRGGGGVPPMRTPKVPKSYTALHANLIPLFVFLCSSMVYWSCGWFTGRVDGSLVVWMVYWSCGWFTSRVDGLLVVWMVYWSCGWFTGSVDGSLVVWMVYWSCGWCTGRGWFTSRVDGLLVVWMVYW